MISKRFLCSPVIFLCWALFSLGTNILLLHCFNIQSVSVTCFGTLTTHRLPKTQCHSNYINKAKHTIHVYGSTKAKLETLHPVTRFQFIERRCGTLNLAQFSAGNMLSGLSKLPEDSSKAKPHKTYRCF
jgi:hypothetical protein